jgi:subtilisin-like proprotein convertase family protein
MNEHVWTRRWTHATLMGLTLALVVSGLGPDAAGTASARGRIGKLEVETFQNTTPIAITDNTTSSPSSIVVNGFDTPIADVNVSLNVYDHTQPADVDVLLVGPAGQTALIMSDVAATTVAVGENLTLDDQDPDQLPQQSDLESGTFQPTNYDFSSLPDSFAPNPLIPAPLPSGSALAVFNGTDANGTWTLFVDDADNDTPDTSGSFGAGWSLRITTANGVPTAGGESFQANAGQPLTVPADGVLGNDSDPDGDSLEAILAGPPRQGSLALQPDGGFTYTPNKKAKGSDSFTYLAQDPSGLNALATVDIQIKKKKDKKKGKGGKKRKR